MVRVSRVAPSNSTPRSGIPALVLGSGTCPPLAPPAAGGVVVGVVVTAGGAPPPSTISGVVVAVAMAGAEVAVVPAVGETTVAVSVAGARVAVAVTVAICCPPTTSTVLMFEKTGRLRSRWLACACTTRSVPAATSERMRVVIVTSTRSPGAKSGTRYVTV